MTARTQRKREPIERQDFSWGRQYMAESKQRGWWVDLEFLETYKSRQKTSHITVPQVDNAWLVSHYFALHLISDD